MSWRLETVREVKGLQVHHVAGDRLVASRGLNLLGSEDAGVSWHTLARIPAPLLRRALARVELLGRLTRGFVGAVLPLSDHSEWIVIANKRVYRVERDGRRVMELWPIVQGRSPLRRGLCIVDDRLYIGDYVRNFERAAVHVHRVCTLTGEADTWLTFQPGDVRHIHVVQHDPFTGRIWIGTGDEDRECRIGHVHPEGGAVEWVGGGSQDWRSVSLFFDENSVIWGTDNHRGENRIVKLDRANRSLETLGDVNGPVYYQGACGRTLLFGTSVEKGEGQQDELGRMYAVAAGGVQQVAAWRKDRWGPVLFGYGILEFAETDTASETCWVTLKGFAGGLRSLCLRLDRVLQ